MGSMVRAFRCHLGVGFAAALLIGKVDAQVPVLVKDINTFPSHPRQLGEAAVHDGRVYIHTESGDSSAELVSVSISDGSYRFERDLAPASLNAPMASAGPLYYIKQVGDGFNSASYFIEAHHDVDEEPWRGPEVLGERFWQPQSIATVGPLAFFASKRDDSFQAGLYVTDGSDDGTARVHSSFHVYPFSLRVLDGKVLFIDVESSARLWSVDPATMKLSALLSDMGSPRIVWNEIVDGEYGIIAERGCSQVLVVRSGGLPENTRQQSFDLGSPCFGLSDDVVMHQGDVYIGGERLLKLDFKSGAVEQVAGPCAFCYYSRLTSLGDTLVYAHTAGWDEQAVLHRLVSMAPGHASQPILHQGQPVPLASPGGNKPFSVLGNRILTNCVEGACTSRATDDSLERLGGGLWFGALATDITNEGSSWFFSGTSDLTAGIWQSNGLSTGTTLLYEVPSQTVDAFPYGPPALGVWVDDTMVLGQVNVCEYPWAACGRGIARSDGSVAGTWVVPDSLAGEGLYSLHNFGDRVLASASTNGGYILLTLSAELDDVRVLAGPEQGMGTFVVTNADVDPDFALRQCTGSLGTNICAESALGASSVRVLPESTCMIDSRALGNINGRALFSILPCGVADPWQLWSSGGTPQSTFRIPGVEMPGVTPFDTRGVRLGEHFYFTASASGDWGLWRTNGASASAEQIGAVPGIVEKMASGELLYFQISRDNQREIWRSDGTAQGTFFLQGVNQLIDLKVVDDRAHWINRENFQSVYWVSDGTVAGTHPVPEQSMFEPAGDIFELPQPFKDDSPVGWSAVFACDSEAFGRELCGIRADGSGMGLAADIAKGERGSAPTGFRTNGRKVFFVANDQWHGNEIHELRSETILRSDLEH